MADMLAADGLDVSLECVDSREDFEVALGKAKFQLILSDYNLPSFDGLAALAMAQERRPDVPFILVSGALGEEIAVESLRAGASDYVLKHRLRRLGPVVRRALNEAAEHQQRKAAEEALTRSQERYQAIVETASEWFWEVDAETRFTYVSPRLQDILGWRSDEVLGRTPFDLMAPGEGRRVREIIDGIAARREAFSELENVCIHRNGRLVVLETSGVPVVAAKGSFEGFRGMSRDITQRKRASELLLASEEKHRLLVEHIPEVVWRCDEKRNVLFISESATRVFGYPPQDIYNAGQKLWTERIHPEDAERVRAGYEALFRAGAIYDVEYRFRGLDGNWMWLHDRAMAVRERHGILYADGLAADITLRRRTEHQLRKLARAVEQSPVSIIITNREGAIEFVNPKFTQVTGYTEADVKGKDFRVFGLCGGGETDYEQLWRTVCGGQEWRGEFPNRKKDGTTFWEAASISPVRDEAGNLTHFIAVKEDITEKRLTEAKLLRAQRVESIGSLASGIAHDLNNILTPILMCAPMIEVEEDPEGRHELAQTIESSAQRAVEIVKQLLGFARGKDGRRASVQARHLIREIAKIARETFPRNITIEDRCETDLWTVEADATQIHQVLLNLCVNARDAMPLGGKLILQAENVVLDDHFASMHADASPGAHVRIRVEDTGHGIPESIQEHIFETFFTTKDEGQGTGLGLTTVRGIIRDHGGFVTFSTRENHGTTFEIHLPADAAARAGEQPTIQAPALPRGTGELILVVDDEPSIRDANRRTLERHGYRVLLAGDGVDALAQFTKHYDDIRVVVTDVMMPQMDGVTLCRVLRKLRPDAPVIVSSGGLFGKSGNDILRSLDQIGTRHILHKPHNAELLLRTLAAVLKTGP